MNYSWDRPRGVRPRSSSPRRADRWRNGAGGERLRHPVGRRIARTMIP